MGRSERETVDSTQRRRERRDKRREEHGGAWWREWRAEGAENAEERSPNFARIGRRKRLPHQGSPSCGEVSGETRRRGAESPRLPPVWRAPHPQWHDPGHRAERFRAEYCYRPNGPAPPLCVILINHLAREGFAGIRRYPVGESGELIEPGPYLLACTYPRRRGFHLASEACGERLLQNLGRRHFRVTDMRRAKEFRPVRTQHHVSWLVFHLLAALFHRIVGAVGGQASGRRLGLPWCGTLGFTSQARVATRGQGIGIKIGARRDLAADCRCDGLFSPGIGKSLATRQDLLVAGGPFRTPTLIGG